MATNVTSVGKSGIKQKIAGVKKKGKEKENGNQKGAEQKNVGEEYITVQADKEQYNFDTFDACNADVNDNCLIYYDWLADTATTSHVMHHREAFTNYTTMGNSSITGVGSKEALIADHGTVGLNSTCNGTDYILHLENVLHVPGHKIK